MKEAEEICPRSREEWRDWLELNHKEKDAVWLVFYKKGTPNFNLSWSESVDESLCFGWIDSTKRQLITSDSSNISVKESQKVIGQK